MKQTHRWDGLIVAFLFLLSFTAQAQVVTITEFGAGITAGAGVGGITSGPDGNLWFTEQLGDRPVPLGWAYPAGLSQNAVYRRVIPIKQSSNLMERLTLPPML